MGLSSIKRMSLEGKLLAVAFLVLVLMGGMARTFYQEFNNFSDDLYRISLNGQQALALQQVLSNMRESESTKFYVAAGQGRLADSVYGDTLQDLQSSLVNLRSTFSSAAGKQGIVSQIDQLVSQYIAAGQAELAGTRAGTGEAERRTVTRLAGTIQTLQETSRVESEYERKLATLRIQRSVLTWAAAACVALVVVLLFVMMVLNEIKRNRELSRRLQYHADHDVLTGLPNRAFFIQALSHTIARAKRESTRAAVLYLDLNGFKPINDSLGHEVGDMVLAEVARRLRSAVQDSDVVARLGGDEFVVLAPSLRDDKETHILKSKISDAIAGVSLPILNGRKLGVAIGVAVYPDDSLTAEGMLSVADQAMYANKNQTKGAVEAPAGKSKTPLSIIRGGS